MLGLKQLLEVCYFKSNGFDIKCACSQKLFEANCEYELHSLPNKKVGGAKDHGENYINVSSSMVRHLLRNRLLDQIAGYWLTIFLKLFPHNNSLLSVSFVDILLFPPKIVSLCLSKLTTTIFFDHCQINVYGEHYRCAKPLKVQMT